MSNVTDESRIEASHGSVPRGVAGASAIRWTYIVPTLLVVWILSMIDKLNIY